MESGASSAPIAIAEIREAYGRIRDRIKRTPMDTSRTLSELAGADVLLKLENMQRTGSYKPRGALNVIAGLTEPERRRGVVTLSAGNWAQAMAMAATVAGVPCVVVMPSMAVSSKVDATRSYGAEVVLYGTNSVEMEQRTLAIAAERGMEFVSPFDNRRMIAGHGTLGLEIAEQVPELTHVLIPVGGGSLIAGCGSALKAVSPAIRVVGVSAEGAASVYESLRAGHVVEVPVIDTIADGLAVKRPGEGGFAIVRQVVDEIVLVSDAEIRRAMAWALARQKIVLEPAGATALAGLMSGRAGVAGTAVVVCSGGNVPLGRLCELAG
jgi:threonine dehydratase